MPSKTQENGCYAYVVLFASFVVLWEIGGAAFSVSTTNVLFLKVFGQSKALTSWAGALHSSVLQISGEFTYNSEYF
jgi:hypothetical protein